MLSDGAVDFDSAPDSRWTVRGAAEDLTTLLRQAAAFLDSLGPVAVSGIRLDRDGDGSALTVSFDHWQLPADLDYLDPRVAAGYYDEGSPRVDRDFMVALADELDAHAVVDFGCGTGQLALTLAERGHRVIGVDPAKAMLDQARTREGAELVEWVWGHAAALAERDVDLVVMTGNIPSIYVTDDGWHELLSALRAALRPGGHLAFGSWNPDARPWERWGRDVVVLLPRDGGARVRPAGSRVGIELADGRETLYSPSEWRYRTREELTRSLTAAGFRIERTYGDWDRSPHTATSPEIVVVARRI